MTGKVVIESPAVTASRMQPLLTKTTATTTDSSIATKDVAKRKDNGSGNGNGNGNGDSNGRGCSNRNGIRYSKVGEAVGGTAAVCCCCPCAVMHLLVLAVYRVPTGLCRKAWRKKKSLQQRRLLKKKNRSSSMGPQPNLPLGPKPIGLGFSDNDDDDDDDDGDGSVTEIDENFEMEMWEQVYRGFWRSPSQKED